jgi:hypothetical protein
MKFTRFAVAAMALALAPAGAGGLAQAGAAAPAERADTYHVSLKISAKQATAREDTVKLKGTLSPVPPKGSKVVVQVKYENGTTWRKLGSAKVDRSGSYTFLDKPKSHLDRAYRVVKAKDDKAGKGTSRERGLHVLAWSWLTGTEPSAAENVLAAYTMPINGDDYAQTLYGDRTKPTAFTEFTLGRNCVSLDATLGLSDRTETGGKALIHLTRDSAVAYDRVFDLGQSEHVTIDMTNVYRLRFDFAQVANTPATEPSAGSAKVLCD